MFLGDLKMAKNTLKMFKCDFRTVKSDKYFGLTFHVKLSTNSDEKLNVVNLHECQIFGQISTYFKCKNIMISTAKHKGFKLQTS